MIEMLQATFFTTAEEICNQLLKRDPITLQHLSYLEGNVIAVEISSPQQTLFILPHSDGIQIQAQCQNTPDAILSGTALDFFTLLTTKNKADAMFGKTIKVSGDSTLATRFQEILADAQIDWEMILADIIGELPAHQLALYLKWKASWYKGAGSSLLANLDEYLKEEIRFLPTRPETDSFYTEIDALQERVERLSAKISALHTA